MKDMFINTVMSKKKTEKIKLWGIVQGVGFRPFVAKIAEKMDMKGEVRNIGGLVEIVVTDMESRIDEFINVLTEQQPLPAEIVHISRIPAGYREFGGFTILDSRAGDREAAMIPADLAICPDCLAEMKTPEDRRYRHPFISCMICGPRYTITDRFPYDRENTSMTDFHMCNFCEGQYKSIKDRRYHAQTISCHECGPQLLMRIRGRRKDEYEGYCDRDTGRILSRSDAVIRRASDIMKEGKVIAFKSMGGYNLMADPSSENGSQALRNIKVREEKPFAVMFENVDQIRDYCLMSDTEEKLVTSSARPILILERRTDGMPSAGGRTTWNRELGRSRFIGSFLPSMGAQYMLLSQFGGPLIATSANISDMPIIKEDEEMLEMMEKEPLISAVLYNKRKIRVSADDSVVREIDRQPQMIRRSKGYAPVPLYVEKGAGIPAESFREQELFAAGGQLKNSFALSKGPFVYMSQYFGDLDSSENRDIYEANVGRMADLFRIRPEKVICDLHPLYFTTGFAERYAEENNISLIKVQHHHAHVASVMAEHDLHGPVIGVSFDGTGYGTDGAIWGGEFLLCSEGRFSREAHLKYVKMIGGDSSMKEGWKSALSYIKAYKDRSAAEGSIRPENGREIVLDIGSILEYAENSGFTKRMKSDTGIIISKALEQDINTIESSSMGRLFDGAASMLGICDYNSYEGQCAIMLEDAAARGAKDPGAARADDLALTFHKDVAKMILDQCRIIRDDAGNDVIQVALTGGVFQNRILMEETLGLLRDDGFVPYYNISVSPNDGGIALGQIYAAMRQ